MSRPTSIQKLILTRLAEKPGWVIEESPAGIAIYDSHRVLRRYITRRTFDQLLLGRWIERDLVRPGVTRWRISDAGRRAVAGSRLFGEGR
jgi:hypothetical protein